MATIKVKFRASSIPSEEGTLFYQVIHERVSRQVKTGYKIYPGEWDAIHTRIIVPPGIGDIRNNYLVSLKEFLSEDDRRFKEIISRLERTGSYTAAEIVKRYLSYSDIRGFLSFARDIVKELELIGKPRTAERYTTVINSFKRFCNGNDIYLYDVDSNLIVRYENFLKAAGLCPNTTSYYMRGLRAIYNRAVEKGLTQQRLPFKDVYTGIDKTVKRAVPLNIIRQIREMDLSLFPSTDFARDIFMFSFYTRGMSFIDMAFLKKKNLQNGVLSYRRQKTGRRLSIKWEKPMQEIVDKYGIVDTPYLLPIIKDMDVDARRQYKNAAHLVNDKLKRLGEKLGLAIPLTTYVARHGWASIARSKNIPLPIISEAMGHNSEKTTLVYLASLDSSAVDEANICILKDLQLI